MSLRRLLAFCPFFFFASAYFNLSTLIRALFQHWIIYRLNLFWIWWQIIDIFFCCTQTTTNVLSLLMDIDYGTHIRDIINDNIMRYFFLHFHSEHWTWDKTSNQKVTKRGKKKKNASSQHCKWWNQWNKNEAKARYEFLFDANFLFCDLHMVFWAEHRHFVSHMHSTTTTTPTTMMIRKKNSTILICMLYGCLLFGCHR